MCCLEKGASSSSCNCSADQRVSSLLVADILGLLILKVPDPRKQCYTEFEQPFKKFKKLSCNLHLLHKVTDGGRKIVKTVKSKSLQLDSSRGTKAPVFKSFALNNYHQLPESSFRCGCHRVSDAIHSSFCHFSSASIFLASESLFQCRVSSLMRPKYYSFSIIPSKGPRADLQTG